MTPGYWNEAKDHLGRRDRVLRKLIRAHPDASLRTRGNAFQTLARSIVGQQISVKAAQSVWNRFALAASDVSPSTVLELSDATIRSCGLSRAKVVYIKDLAAHFDDGRLNARRWHFMNEERVIEDLVRVKGIGRWSAEMFLIFHLMRPNILPVGDLGLQRAMERHYNGGDPITQDDMREIARPWEPWSSVATWYLWRSLDPVPVEY